MEIFKHKDSNKIQEWRDGIKEMDTFYRMNDKEEEWIKQNRTFILNQFET